MPSLAASLAAGPVPALPPLAEPLLELLLEPAPLELLPLELAPLELLLDDAPAPAEFPPLATLVPPLLDELLEEGAVGCVSAEAALDELPEPPPQATSVRLNTIEATSNNVARTFLGMPDETSLRVCILMPWRSPAGKASSVADVSQDSVASGRHSPRSPQPAGEALN